MNLDKEKYLARFKKEEANEWDILAEEMGEFYGRNMFGFVRLMKKKYPEFNIKRAWHIAQKERDKEFSHLVQNIKG